MSRTTILEAHPWISKPILRWCWLLGACLLPISPALGQGQIKSTVYQPVGLVSSGQKVLVSTPLCNPGSLVTPPLHLPRRVLQLDPTSGAPTLFSDLNGLPGADVACTTTGGGFASNLAISPGLGNFSAGTVFVLVGSSVYQIPSGGGKPALFVTLPKPTHTLLFDQVGSFGYSLIVGTYPNALYTDLYTITAKGEISQIGTVPSQVEGMAIAPDSFGIISQGDLVVAGRSDGNIYDVTPAGDVHNFASGLSQPGYIAFIPPQTDLITGFAEAILGPNSQNESANILGGKPGSITISKGSMFNGHGGQLLVATRLSQTASGGTALYALAADGTPATLGSGAGEQEGGAILLKSPELACPTGIGPPPVWPIAVGNPFSSPLVPIGGIGPFTFSINGGALPPGLSLNTATGSITGTPTASGEFAFTAQVADSSTPQGSYTVSCSLAIPDTKLIVKCAKNVGQVGVGYTSAFTATGGTPPYTFSVASGNFPVPGLTLNPATGAVTGTPAVAGTYSYAAQVTDATGKIAQVNCAITIEGVLAVSCPAQYGDVGTPYSSNATGSGANGHYTFDVTAGKLPKGLKMTEAGLVSGKPTTNGIYPFTVQVQSGTEKATKQCMITITNLLESCVPNSSLGVLSQNGNVTAYYPNGSWSESATGVQVIPLEGTSGPSRVVVQTPAPVNACSSNWNTGQTVCTGNSNDVYLISGSSLTNTLTSDAKGTEYFSGGKCTTCGVAIDSGTNIAIIEQANGDGKNFGGKGALQFLNLKTNKFQAKPFLLKGEETSENISVDPVRSLVLSANEGFFNSNSKCKTSLDSDSTDVLRPCIPDFQIVQLQPTKKVFSFANAAEFLTGAELDSVAEDCSTGIAVAADEYTSSVFLTDLSQATYSATTWTAPSNLQNIPEFAGMASGISGIAVAPGSHLGIVVGEYCCGTSFGVFQLPSAGGNGTPALVDWASMAMPNDPSGAAWTNGLDPHTVTAYVSPNTGKAMAVLGNDKRTYLALVDLQGVLDNAAGTHHAGVNPQDSGLITFVSIQTPFLFCSSAKADVDTQYSSSFSVEGLATPLTFSVSGTLPPGLSLNPATGAVTGSPNTVGAYTFTAQVVDALNTTASNSCTIVVQPGPSLSCPAATAQLYQPYSSSTAVSGGSAPYVFSLGSGSLPNGLTLNTASGAITGVPLAATTATFTTHVSDSFGGTATSSSCSITVAPASMTGVAPQTSGLVGIPYFSEYVAGGAPPYTPSFSSGSLPPGLTASSSGVITGTPTTTGAYPFVIQIVDSAGSTASISSTITISSAPGAVYSSCNPSSGLSVLLSNGGKTVTAYVPNGGYLGNSEDKTTGIQAVGLEGGGALTTIATPGAVNACASNWSTGETVCTSNTNQVYLITGTTLNKTLTDKGSKYQYYPDGYCTTCGVVINNLLDEATIEIATGNGVGSVQTLNLHTNAFGTPIKIPGQTAESVTWDAVHGLLLSPNTGQYGLPGYTLLNGTKIFNFADPNGLLQPDDLLAAGAADCSTGIALATQESTGNLFITDLTQATFDSIHHTWNAPAQIQTLPELAALPNGTVNMAMAGASHLGVVTGSNASGNSFAIIQLPATAGSGTPAVADWVVATIPNDPSGVAWQVGGTPSRTGAYVSATTGRSLAVMGNAANSYLAVADMLALLKSPRIAGTHNINPNVDLVAQKILVWKAASPPAITCPLLGGYVNTSYSGMATAIGGFPPYTFSVNAGALPSGLSMDSLGNVSGTPDTLGPNSFTLQVIDSTGTASGTGTKQCGITIAMPLTISGNPPANGQAGVAYSATFGASGGFPPYTFTANNGSNGFPPGLSFNANASTATISGTPILAGSYSLAVSLADSLSSTNATFPITISPAALTTACPLGTAQTNLAYFSQFITFGNPPYTITPSAALPPGLSANTSTGILSGTPTAAGTYNFDLQVGDSQGGVATAAGCSITVTAPDPNVLSSCQTANGISVLAKGGNVTAYFPAGSWQETTNNIAVVPVEGGGGISTITTPTPVSACASNWVTGETACTDSGTNVYLITGSTLNRTLNNNAGGSTGQEEGSCDTCNVMVDASQNLAEISVSEPSNNVAAGIQPLNLANNKFSALLPMNNFGAPGGPGMDPLRHLIVAGTDYWGLPIVLTQGPPAAGTYSLQNDALTPNISSAEDCTTGVAVTMNNSGNGWSTHSTFYVFDMSQATFDPLQMLWNAPNQTQVLPEFDQGNGLSDGPSGISIAPGTHVGLVTSEYCCGAGFGAIQLPATSGSGTPAIMDWVEASMPNDPSGNAWQNGGAPHLVTAYVSPTTGKAMGVMGNDARTYLALVDIQALLNAPRLPSAPCPDQGQFTATCANYLDPGQTNLLTSGIVTYLAAAPPTLACPSPTDWDTSVPYSYNESPAGGFPPYNFSILLGSLPTGLSLSSTGSLTGTPTVNGTFNFTIQVADSTNTLTGSNQLSCSMKIATLALTGNLPPEPAGNPYSQVFTASGGFPPYSFSISGLPSGLNSNSNGATFTISGAAAVQGSYPVSLQLSDSVTSITQQFTFVVGPELLTAQCPLSTATSNITYFSQVANGGMPPYTITPTASLPAGLTANASGVINGIPTGTGTFAFGLSIMDSVGSSANVSGCSIAVAPAINPNILSSCQTANGISVLAHGSGVTAYFPAGSWQEHYNNITAVPVEGGGAFANIATPTPVNSCASNWQTGETVCTDNGTNVYLINGATLTKTLTDAASQTTNENEGSCSTCSVMVDSSTNMAAISETLGWNNSGIQYLDLAANTFKASYSLSNTGASGGPAMDPLRHLVVAGTDSWGLPVVMAQGPPAPGIYSLTPSNNPNISTAEDCTTGIAVTVNNTGNGWNSHNSFYVFDMSQATFDPVPGTWTTVSQTQLLPEFDYGNGLEAGPSGIAIAPGTHIGLVAGEYCCSTGFGAIVLPSTSGSGTPAIADWVEASMPNDPSGVAWKNGGAPHLLTAYVSPNTGKAMGVMGNDSRTYLALVDIQALLNAPRLPSGPCPYSSFGQTCANYLDPAQTNLVTSGIVTFLPSAPPIVSCPVPSTGYVGIPYSYTESPTGGVPPYTISITDGTLPTGLSLDPPSGIISGSPTTAGIFNFAIQVVDSTGTPGGTNTASCGMTIYPPVTLTGNLPPEPAGTSYTATLTASGGSSPYSFFVTGLPSGLSYSVNAGTSVTILGIAITQGSYPVTINVTDSAQTTFVSNYTFIVGPELVTVSCPLSLAQTSLNYFSQLSTGGVPPFTFTPSAALPPGLTANANGVLTGMPTTAGTYPFNLQVMDSLGSTASVTGCTITVAAPDPNVLASCQTANGISVLAQGSTVTAYLPAGSWQEVNPNVVVVPVEGAATLSTIVTPTPVNSCASNWVTGETVCTDNGTNVYLITGMSLNNTLTDTGSRSTGENEGSCTTCNVMIDASTNMAAISESQPWSSSWTNSGIQYLDLSAGTFTTLYPLANVGAPGGPAMDPLRHLIIAGTDSGGFPVVLTQSPPASGIYNLAPENATNISAAEDCTTGIGVTMNNTGNGQWTHSSFYVFDLSQAAFDPILGSWSSANQTQVLPDFDNGNGLPNGPSGIAIAPGTHVGLVTSEYCCGGGFGAIALPTTAGSGTPAVADWVEATMPNVPSGGAWQNGGAPHLVTAYVSPNTGKAMGVMANDARTYLALVDIQGLLNAPRLPAAPCPQTNGGLTCANYLDPNQTNLLTSGIVTYLAAAQPTVSCPSPVSADVSIAYSYQEVVTGGFPPYTYSIVSGALPGGLSLDPVLGTVSGTPTNAGVFDFTVQVLDSSGSPSGMGSSSCGITIYPAVTVAGNLPAEPSGVAYSAALTATGGFPPYNISVSGLPSGLSASANGGILTISGTAITQGSYPVTVSVTDSVPSTFVNNYTLVVGPELVTAACPVGTAQTTLVYYSPVGGGGVPPFTITPSAALPPGLTANANGIISGVPTAHGTYSFNLQVVDSQGSTATASGCSIAVRSPNPKILASCQTASGISVLGQGANVTAYVPAGSWLENNNGIAIVPIEGTGSAATISTSTAVNSCASNWVTGEIVCTDNGTNVYLVSGGAVANVVTDAASASTSNNSEGSCQTCSAMVDASSNQAIISESVCSDSWGGSCWATGGGVQLLDLGPGTFENAIAVNPSGSPGGPAMDPLRHLILAATDYWGFPMVSTQGPPAVGTYGLVGGPSDNVNIASAEDCTTGIGVTLDNNSNAWTTHNSFYVFDLSQATFDPILGQWNVPNQIQVLPEFDADNGLSNGPSGIAIAPGTHIGLIISQFCCGGGFGAIVLPATSGTGTPSIVDWVEATLPNDPSGAAWQNGGAPHLVTAYVSPNTGKAMGVMSNDSRTYLALIDIQALLNANRVSMPLNYPSNGTGNNYIDPTIDLVASGILTWIPVPAF